MEEIYLTTEEQVDLWDAVHEYARLSYSGEELPVEHPNTLKREIAVIDLNHTVIRIIENKLNKGQSEGGIMNKLDAIILVDAMITEDVEDRLVEHGIETPVTFEIDDDDEPGEVVVDADALETIFNTIINALNEGK